MASPITLKCPGCNAPLAAPDGRSEFFCQYCGGLVRVPQPAQPETYGSGATSERKTKPVPGIPEALTVDRRGGELRISWRWFKAAGLFLVPFCIAWNGFLVGWYSLAFSIDGPPGAMRIIMLVFPVGHLAIGLGLLYACLVLLLNRTRIQVSFGTLSVRNGPIPAGGNRNIDVREIDQIYVKRDIGSSNGKTSFPLMVRLNTGHEIKLLRKNAQLDIARAVEHLIESHLGLRDRSMANEYIG